jgi:hypothetical protein
MKTIIITVLLLATGCVHQPDTRSGCPESEREVPEGERKCDPDAHLRRLPIYPGLPR